LRAVPPAPSQTMHASVFASWRDISNLQASSIYHPVNSLFLRSRQEILPRAEFGPFFPSSDPETFLPCIRIKGFSVFRFRSTAWNLRIMFFDYLFRLQTKRCNRAVIYLAQSQPIITDHEFEQILLQSLAHILWILNAPCWSNTYHFEFLSCSGGVFSRTAFGNSQSKRRGSIDLTPSITRRIWSRSGPRAGRWADFERWRWPT
jgi:hypothetical protein